MSEEISGQAGATVLTGIRKAANTTDAYSSGVTGDATDRFVIDADGKQWWGDGTAALSEAMERFAGGLKFTGSIRATVDIRARDGAGTRVFIGGVAGDPGIGFNAGGTTTISEVAAGRLQCNSGSGVTFESQRFAVIGTAGNGYVEGTQQASGSDPSAPAAGKARWYTRDNGAGKGQLCVRFPSGAVQVVATEP